MIESQSTYQDLLSRQKAFVTVCTRYSAEVLEKQKNLEEKVITLSKLEQKVNQLSIQKEKNEIILRELTSVENRLPSGINSKDAVPNTNTIVQKSDTTVLEMNRSQRRLKRKLGLDVIAEGEQGQRSDVIDGTQSQSYTPVGDSSDGKSLNESSQSMWNRVFRK